MKFNGLRATVMGLGLFGGGCAAARWLAHQGAIVTVTDTASEEILAGPIQSLADISIHRFTFGEHQKRDFTEADLVVVNPAVPPGNPWLEIAEKAGALLTSEMDLFLNHCPAHVIAVTGSNGKSTTTAMIASILEAADRKTFLGGNIGRSLLMEVSSMEQDDFVVLELSSFQLHRLGRTVAMPATAVITNFTANHLNWHPDLHHYRAAKQRLLREQPSYGTAVFDPSAPGLEGWKELLQGSFAAPHDVSDLPPLSVRGRHNESNAALAATVACCADCTPDAIDVGLRRFKGLPDRLERVASTDTRRFFNDSSSTTPESTMAALRAVEKPIWLLAGGTDKGAPCDELVDCIVEQAAGGVFYGQVADRLARQVRSRMPDFDAFAVKTLAEAVARATDRASADAAVLLSPGFSSKDQFVNYRARAAAFVKLVKAYRS